MKKQSGRIIIGILCLTGIFITALKAHSIWRHFNERLDLIACLAEDQPISGIVGDNNIFLGESPQIIELNSLNTEFDLPVKFSFPNYIKIHFDGIELESGKPVFYRFNKISESQYVPIQVDNTRTNVSREILVRTYPEFMPHFTTVGVSPLDGDYYLNSFNPNALLKLDRAGNILYYKYGQGAEFSDFKKVKTEDGDRHIYNARYENNHAMNNVMYTPVEYVVLDEQYKEINRIKMSYSEKIPFEDFPADSHDIIYLDDSHYYVISYMGKNVKNLPSDLKADSSSRVVACIIQEIKDNKVVFEWDSTDFPELYIISEHMDFSNNLAEFNDYAHMNSIEIDPSDGNLLCSFRNLSTILKIDLKTGDIIWRLGGRGDEYHLEEEQMFSCQHFARYNMDGSLSIFDNGNQNKQSRIVKFWLDEKNKKVIDWKVYTSTKSFSVATGSAQKISDSKDIFVVGWGIRTSSLTPSVSEINFSTDETYFELFFDGDTQSYRCVKY